jgi:hypothetical protein
MLFDFRSAPGFAVIKDKFQGNHGEAMRYLLRNLLGAFAMLAFLTAASAMAQQAPPHPRALEGRVVDKFTGLGLNEVVVRLYSSQGTLMDIVETEGSGLYHLDLGVLDRSDFATLDSFYVEVTDKQGRKARIGLVEASSSQPGVLVLPLLSLP